MRRTKLQPFEIMARMMFVLGVIVMLVAICYQPTPDPEAVDHPTPIEATVIETASPTSTAILASDVLPTKTPVTPIVIRFETPTPRVQPTLEVLATNIVIVVIPTAEPTSTPERPKELPFAGGEHP